MKNKNWKKNIFFQPQELEEEEGPSYTLTFTLSFPHNQDTVSYLIFVFKLFHLNI